MKFNAHYIDVDALTSEELLELKATLTYNQQDKVDERYQDVLNDMLSCGKTLKEAEDIAEKFARNIISMIVNSQKTTSIKKEPSQTKKHYASYGEGLLTINKRHKELVKDFMQRGYSLAQANEIADKFIQEQMDELNHDFGVISDEEFDEIKIKNRSYSLPSKQTTVTCVVRSEASSEDEKTK